MACNYRELGRGRSPLRGSGSNLNLGAPFFAGVAGMPVIPAFLRKKDACKACTKKRKKGSS